jgi:hypothetical protein
LNIKSLQNGILNFRERFTLETNTPLTKFDNSKIKLINKDSTTVAFTTEYDDFNQQLFFDFKREPSESYTLNLMPDALTDYLEQTNDTLTFKVITRSLADYGNLTINLINVKRFPVIVELTNDKGDVIATGSLSIGTEKSTSIDFNLLEPAVFSLRAIYDDNKNNLFDTGNYLEKRQAEEVIYFSKAIDVRANWDVVQPFDLSLPYIPEPVKKAVKKKKTSY